MLYYFFLPLVFGFWSFLDDGHALIIGESSSTFSMLCLRNAVVLAIVGNVRTIVAVQKFQLVIFLEGLEVTLLLGFCAFP